MVNQKGILEYIEKKKKKKSLVRQIIERTYLLNTKFVV